MQLEDGSLLRVSQGERIDFALYDGMELDDKTLKQLKAAAAESALRERAVSLLSVRPLSEGELCRRLQDKGATQAQARRVVDWTKRLGLLDDGAYAKAIVRHYQARGYGLYKIRDELYRRRVPKMYWEEALAEGEEPDGIIDRLIAAKLTDSENRKEIKRVSDALARRGFSWEEISAGLRRFREKQC